MYTVSLEIFCLFFARILLILSMPTYQKSIWYYLNCCSLTQIKQYGNCPRRWVEEIGKSWPNFCFSHDLQRKATKHLFNPTTKALSKHPKKKEAKWRNPNNDVETLWTFECEWRFNDPCQVLPQFSLCFVAFVIWLSVKLPEILVITGHN